MDRHELEERADDALDPTEGFALPRDEHDHPYLDSPDQAGWALRKLARLRKLLADVDAIEQERVAKTEAWAEDERGRLLPDVEFFEGLLVDWHERLLAEDDKRKSVSLPDGVLKSRATQPKVTVEDVDAAIGWVDDPGFLDLLFPEKPAQRRPSLSAFKQQIKDGRLVATDDGTLIDADTGEVVPGVTVTPAGRSFTVEVTL